MAGNDPWWRASFARRRYSRSLENVEVVVSGIPYDCAVTNRSGCRLGPRAIRAGSTQLAELKHFPFGFNPFDHLSVIDFGDCYLDPHHPQSVFITIEHHADLIVGSDARMLSLGGDHSVSYPLLKAHAKNMGRLRWFSLMRIVIHGRMMVRGLITVPCLHGLQMRALLMLRHQPNWTTHL
ncbi:MAG: hypothetical protein CM15mP46_3590 [Alphaproteobacteria bacterium]|nr:MAG: hypothetical protein CM15mP46_3590 [Alphaproteobacteria bacterium]